MSTDARPHPRSHPSQPLGWYARACEDIDAAIAGDPAASSRLEVVLCYPGLHAVWGHRLAHRLWNAGHRLAARLVSQLVRGLTGVEIHPGATIGRRLFIDHGMGVVIGQTAHIGDDVVLFHGVTLGGKTRHPTKRHPTLGNRVMVGAGATLLGPVEVGDDARIGAGAVVTHNIPAATTATGIPARPLG